MGLPWKLDSGARASSELLSRRWTADGSVGGMAPCMPEPGDRFLSWSMNGPMKWSMRGSLKLVGQKAGPGHACCCCPLPEA